VLEWDVQKMPSEVNPLGILFWRRPTLARPIAVLPLGLQRFTSVFGMGTGGATALGSPEVRAGLGIAVFRAGADLWRLATIQFRKNNQLSADPLTSTYRFSERSAVSDRGYNI
jgi:hypothetical protein